MSNDEPLPAKPRGRRVKRAIHDTLAVLRSFAAQVPATRENCEAFEAIMRRWPVELWPYDSGAPFTEVGDVER